MVLKKRSFNFICHFGKNFRNLGKYLKNFSNIDHRFQIIAKTKTTVFINDSKATNIDAAEGYDLAVLVTAHKACQNIDWAGLASRMRNPILYDGRRVLDLNVLEESGWQVHAVGKPIK